MARPAKSAVLNKKHLTADEREQRLAGEARLRGIGGKPAPPKYLTDAQKKIFRSVVKELEPSGTLCKLDTDILVSYSVAKAALNDINAKIAASPVHLTDKEIISARRQYSSEYFRCLNELGLSPQSRAKMANMAAQAQAADPLLEALRSSPDEDTEERADSFDSVEADLTIEITDEFSGDDDE